MYKNQSKQLLLALLVFLPTVLSAQTESESLTIDDLMSLKSVSNPQVSPDGEWVVYSVSKRDMDKDRSNSQLFMMPAAGGEAIPMTAKDTSASDAQWSPDGKYLSFKASKGEDSKTQVWNLNRLGGEAVQVTDILQGV